MATNRTYDPQAFNWGNVNNNVLDDFNSNMASWGMPNLSSGRTPGIIPDTSTQVSDRYNNLGMSNQGTSPMTNWFGGTNPDGTRVNGIIPTGVSALAGLSSAYLGWQQFNLARDQLDQNKRIFNLNFTNQANLTNTQLEDRQRARVSASPNAESVDSYMRRNRVNTGGI